MSRHRRVAGYEALFLNDLDEFGHDLLMRILLYGMARASIPRLNCFYSTVYCFSHAIQITLDKK